MTMTLPLTVLEEFLLLALDDQTQQLNFLAPSTLDCATAGAILMDLTLLNRIDNDLWDMFTIDATPIGDEILDPVLQMMSLAPVLTPHPIAYWLRQVSDEAESYRDKALGRLEKRGVIRRENSHILWVFGKRRYPLIDEKEVCEVKERILGVILSNETPTPHDIMLTSLAESCGLFGRILNKSEYGAASVRIAQVSRLDLIGQAVAKGVAEIQSAIALASSYR